MDFAKLGNIVAETSITNAFSVVKLGNICEIHPWSKNILTWFQCISLLRERNFCMRNNALQESFPVKPFKLQQR